MEEPDKVVFYIQANPEQGVEYIRKDLVDEMLKTAEDHAFFAGQEKLREKLLKWAKENEKRLGDLLTINNPSLVIGGKLYAYQEFIEKIESL